MHNAIPSRSALAPVAIAFLVVFASSSLSQSPDLQRKVDSLRESIRANREALQNYTWTETQLTLVDDELRSTVVSQCRYAPDGTVSSSPPIFIRGLKRHVAGYMERVATLLQRYTPLEPSSFQGGIAAVSPSQGNVVTLVFNSYAIPGDSIRVTFDASLNAIMSYEVRTYLNSPSDVITLNVVFATLPGGPAYMRQSVLNVPTQRVQVSTLSDRFARAN